MDWISAHEACFGFARASEAPVLLKTTVTAILVEHGCVIGVETDHGPLAAPVVVIATWALFQTRGGPGRYRPATAHHPPAPTSPSASTRSFHRTHRW